MTILVMQSVIVISIMLDKEDTRALVEEVLCKISVSNVCLPGAFISRKRRMYSYTPTPSPGSLLTEVGNLPSAIIANFYNVRRETSDDPARIDRPSKAG